MKPLSGPELARQLAPHFPVGKATRKQSGEFAGCHVIDFFHSGWDKPVLPAAEYAAQLHHHLGENFEVVQTCQELNTWATSPFPMCSTVIIRFVERVTIPIPRLLMLPAPRIAGLLTAGQVATRFNYLDFVRIPDTSRHTLILEVDTNKTQPYYRVSLMDGIDHAWYSEAAMLKANPHGEVIEFPVIRERAA